jgi:hypothetical protein
MVLDNDCQSGDENFNLEDSHCNAAPVRTLAALTQAPPVATKCCRGRHSYYAKMGAAASSPEHMDMKVTVVAVGSDYDEACFRNNAGADKCASPASHTTSATLTTCPPIAACQEEKGTSATTCAAIIAIPHTFWLPLSLQHATDYGEISAGVNNL